MGCCSLNFFINISSILDYKDSINELEAYNCATATCFSAVCPLINTKQIQSNRSLQKETVNMNVCIYFKSLSHFYLELRVKFTRLSPRTRTATNTNIRPVLILWVLGNRPLSRWTTAVLGKCVSFMPVKSLLCTLIMQIYHFHLNFSMTVTFVCGRIFRINHH